MDLSRELLRAQYAEMHKLIRLALAGFTIGGRLDLGTAGAVGAVPPARGGTGSTAGAEPPLGNPPADGYVLASTVAGVRSWVPYGAAAGYFEPVTNGDAVWPEVIFDTDGAIVMDWVAA